MSRYDPLEQGAATQRRFAGVEANLHGARGLHLHYAQTLDRTEHGRQPEATAVLDEDGARRSGRRADAAIEERQRRARRAADDRAGSAALGDASGHLEGVNVSDGGVRERLGEGGRFAHPRRAVKASAHDETGEAHHQGFEEHDDEDIHREIAPETLGMRRVHAVVVVREVADHLGHRVEDVEAEHREHREPHPCTETAVQDPRRDEPRERGRVLEPVGVGPIAGVGTRHVDAARSSCHAQVANSVGGGDLQDDVTGERDAERVESGLRVVVAGEFVVVVSGQHDEPVAVLRAEGSDRLGDRRQRPEGGVDETGEVGCGIGVEKVARDHHDGRVVNVAQEVDELANRTARRVGRWRE